jgi:hypothetical protein
MRTCGLSPFRADQVDEAVWNWVRSFLVDPVALAEGLRAEQSEREKANKPLHDRLAVIDDLLEDSRSQLVNWREHLISTCPASSPGRH